VLLGTLYRLAIRTRDPGHLLPLPCSLENHGCVRCRTAIALLGDKLFAANYSSGMVGEYDASSGVAINASFIKGLTEPVGLAVKSSK
jgi:hypothetical protein